MKTTALFFSATHKTEKVALNIKKGIDESLSINGDEGNVINIASREAQDEIYEFGEDDLVIVGSNTYAGRVPNKIAPIFKDNVKGNGAKAAVFVTYGNRAYDDSLKELAYLMKSNGFKVVAAAAFVAQHSFTDKVANNRPTEEDLMKAYNFGKEIVAKLSDKAGCEEIDIDKLSGRAYEEMQYYKPLKEDGTPAVFLKAKPVTDKGLCDGCGICRKVCPMDCFKESLEEPSGVCIKCMACVADCPQKAKKFTDEELSGHIKMLENNFAGAHREIEIFI